MATPTRIGSCPRCGCSVPLVAENPWRPFCSERCKSIDLGAWMSEQHRIPGSRAPDPDPDSPRTEN